MSVQDGVVEVRPLWFTNQLIRAVPRSAFAPALRERIPPGIFDQLVIRLGGLLRYVPVANLPTILRWQQVADFHRRNKCSSPPHFQRDAPTQPKAATCCITTSCYRRNHCPGRCDRSRLAAGCEPSRNESTLAALCFLVASCLQLATTGASACC